MLLRHDFETPYEARFRHGDKLMGGVNMVILAAHQVVLFLASGVFGGCDYAPNGSRRGGTGIMKPSEKLILKLQERLAEGKELLASAFDLKVARRWDIRTEAIVRSFDPHGSCITNGTAYQIWDHAQWFRGNHPKDLDQEEAVFFQRLSAIEAILDSDIKMAPAPRSDNGAEEASRACPFRVREVASTPNLVFVLMPFTLDWSDRVWRRHIRKAVCGVVANPALVCIRADDLSGQDVMVDIYENILKASVIIADITSRNPNVFYELGIAHALGKRVVLVTQDVQDIPFDLLRFRHIVYQDNSEGCEKLEKELQRYLENCLGLETPVKDRTVASRAARVPE
jgi:hypothetical protein